LRDSSIFIDDSFYILGREDRSVAQFTGKSRAPLKDLTKNLDNNFPIIMMDHTPFGLEEAQKNNIALQLSGHTHHGQMFPANLITKMVYEVSWGYLEKDKTQYYVSCGVGTWGPRVRIGSNSEIINLKINFAK
jgi:predicted MPP superfamily phosphohydrolase